MWLFMHDILMMSYTQITHMVHTFLPFCFVNNSVPFINTVFYQVFSKDSYSDNFYLLRIDYVNNFLLHSYKQNVYDHGLCCAYDIINICKNAQK